MRSNAGNSVGYVVIQILSTICHLLGVLGSVYYLVNVVYYYVNRNEFYFYSDNDLIVLSILFIFSFIGYTIAIFGTFQENLYLLITSEILMSIEMIIFFITGLILAAVWNAIALLLTLIFISFISNEEMVKWFARKNTAQPVVNVTADPLYGYMTDRPPAYNSVAYHKSMPPPAYQAVELIPVPTVCAGTQCQRY